MFYDILLVFVMYIALSLSTDQIIAVGVTLALILIRVSDWVDKKVIGG